MNALLNTYPSNRNTRRRILEKAMTPLPLWLAERNAAAERRHRHLVQLEALFAETPRYCLRQRWLIRKAIAAHQPTMWS